MWHMNPQMCWRASFMHTYVWPYAEAKQQGRCGCRGAEEVAHEVWAPGEASCWGLCRPHKQYNLGIHPQWDVILEGSAQQWSGVGTGQDPRCFHRLTGCCAVQREWTRGRAETGPDWAGHWSLTLCVVVLGDHVLLSGLWVGQFLFFCFPELCDNRLLD
jgi:hypothetical protein